MAMDNEERRKRDGDVGAAGGGSDKAQCGQHQNIKFSHQLN